MKSWSWTGPLRIAALAIALFPPVSLRAQAKAPPAIGVLGDSYSDEYRFYPPDRAQARNWVEILAAARGLNFGAFTSESRGEPRNQGFAHNWARSGAETEDLIRTGQLPGLAAQVARGEVGVVVVFIGGNDFIRPLASKAPGGEVDGVLKRATANLDRALATILRASPDVRAFLVTVPDIAELPEFAMPLRAGRLPAATVAAYSNAVADFNRHLRWLAMANPRVAIVDLALATQFAPRPDADTFLVAGHRLDRIHPANAVDHAFLADSRHIGTLIQGVLANHVINALNARLGTQIAPLGVAEILKQGPQPPQVTSLRP